jgi:hypothetical protein
MTNPLTPVPGSTALPTTATAPQHLLREFPTYAGAERLVDTLSDKGFPVEHTRIVGNGLRTVEYVTGRLTSGRAAQAGAASGASFGLLVGLLLGLFSQDSSWLGTVIGCTLIGAAWWAVFGYVAHRATHGRRDFSSIKGLEAEQYAVYVDADRADEAIRLAGLF